MKTDYSGPRYILFFYDFFASTPAEILAIKRNHGGDIYHQQYPQFILHSVIRVEKGAVAGAELRQVGVMGAGKERRHSRQGWELGGVWYELRKEQWPEWSWDRAVRWERGREGSSNETK